jgi:uncharacterized repeat protein (TIGR03803 family)
VAELDGPIRGARQVGLSTLGRHLSLVYNSRAFSRQVMRSVSLSMAVVLLGCSFMLGQSQYKVLWSFTGYPNDGEFPVANLIMDKSGNLYGTTKGGGSYGYGTVFKLSPNQDGTWTEAILYSFCTQNINNRCQDGGSPQAGLGFDAQGNLYGTTVYGGTVLCFQDSEGCGTVFELSPQGGSWTETVLYSFCTNKGNNVCLDGNLPLSQLTLDSSGNLYGTTEYGGTGTSAAGTVFELSPNGNGWIESVLYTFCSGGGYPACPDGAVPLAGVAFDKAGNLYGTTESGGTNNVHGAGVVFKLSPGANGWAETVLHSFHQGEDGGAPVAGVSFDTLGNLYGTFSAGGPYGGVFRILAKNGKTENFFFGGGGANGYDPRAGVLVDSKHATLYGTTYAGGTGRGVVFEVVAPEEESVLYNFCSQPNCTDGDGSVASVILDDAGNLYGTAERGGTGTYCQGGCGVVFEIVQQAPKGSASQDALKSPHDEEH